VPYFNIFGMIRNLSSVHTINSHKDAPLHDHSFLSPTYEKVLEDHIKDFKFKNNIN
jgi:hypothetical protein